MKHVLIRDFVSKGAHDIVCHTVDKGPNPPRSYQATCKTCGWKGPVGTGTVAAEAMIEHRNETLKAAGQDLEAIGAIPKPKQPRTKKAQAAPAEAAQAEAPESTEAEAEDETRDEAESAQEGEA